MADFNKAAERERNNPKCGDCKTFPTNHYCSFTSTTGDKCGAPVCAMCKGETDVTRCLKHKSLVPNSPALGKEQQPASRKKPRVVARTIQRTCMECKKYPTPLSCVTCKKPLCTSCKLSLNGTLGKYLCAEHAQKLEIQVVTKPPEPKQSSGVQQEKAASTRKRAATTSTTTTSLLIADTDAFLNKQVAFEMSSDIGELIRSQLKCSTSSTTLRRNHILGTVCRKVSGRGGHVIYEVAWNHSQFGVTQMSYSHVCVGIESMVRLQGLSRSRSRANADSSDMDTAAKGTEPSHSQRLRDPYLDDEVIDMINRSKMQDPSLPYCSSESDTDDS